MGKLRHLLMNNLGIKVLSFVLAFLLWYLAAGQEKTEVSLIVPVELSNIPDNVALEGSSLEFVHVRIRGSRSILQDLSPQQLRANLDLRDIKTGDSFVAVSGRDINLPPGVDLVNVSPPYLHIKAATRRLVPVKVTLRGRPAEGYELVKATPTPSQIYIIGDPQRVNDAREVHTLPIGLKGAKQSFTVKADLMPLASDVRLMELKPTEVSVEIRPVMVERVFRSIPVILPAGRAAALNPARVQVVIAGPRDQIGKVEAKDVRAEFDWPEGKEKEQTATLMVSLPEGLEVRSVTPPAVRVTITQP